MSFSTMVCVLLRCDDCRQVLEWEDDAVWHHPTEADAVDAAQAAGWVVTDRVQLCESCAEARLVQGRPAELTPWLGEAGLPPALVPAEPVGGDRP